MHTIKPRKSADAATVLAYLRTQAATATGRTHGADFELTGGDIVSACASKTGAVSFFWNGTRRSAATVAQWIGMAQDNTRNAALAGMARAGFYFEPMNSHDRVYCVIPMLGKRNIRSNGTDAAQALANALARAGVDIDRAIELATCAQGLPTVAHLEQHARTCLDAVTAQPAQHGRAAQVEAVASALGLSIPAAAAELAAQDEWGYEPQPAKPAQAPAPMPRAFTRQDAILSKRDAIRAQFLADYAQAGADIDKASHARASAALALLAADCVASVDFGLRLVGRWADEATAQARN